VDFSPALRWYTARKVESLLEPFASRIRSVAVRITDVEGDLDRRKCVIHAVLSPSGFVSEAALGMESVDRAAARLRAAMPRRLVGDGISRVA
jgi:hypothetical protein